MAKKNTKSKNQPYYALINVKGRQYLQIRQRIDGKLKVLKQVPPAKKLLEKVFEK